MRRGQRAWPPGRSGGSQAWWWGQRWPPQRVRHTPSQRHASCGTGRPSPSGSSSLAQGGREGRSEKTRAKRGSCKTERFHFIQTVAYCSDCMNLFRLQLPTAALQWFVTCAAFWLMAALLSFLNCPLFCAMWLNREKYSPFIQHLCKENDISKVEVTIQLKCNVCLSNSHTTEVNETEHAPNLQHSENILPQLACEYLWTLHPQLSIHWCCDMKALEVGYVFCEPMISKVKHAPDMFLWFLNRFAGWMIIKCVQTVDKWFTTH